MPLSLCVLQISVVALLLLTGNAFKATAMQIVLPATAPATTRDQPNPISSSFFNNATGVLNGTLAIVPIPLATARDIIPAQYNILESAYRSLLPDFPEGMYPVLVQEAHDHDVRFQDFNVPDFSRAGFEFPFLDFLGDGHSNFRWAPEQIISANNDIAVQGSQAYGTVVHPGTFQPAIDAYEAVPGSEGETFFNATGFDGTSERYMNAHFAALATLERFPFPMSFLVNITNQPIFVNGSTCDQMIRLFNTTLGAGEFAPVPVKGRVQSNIGPFKAVTDFTDVFGFQIATAFVENNYQPCENFRGYQLPPDFLPPGFA